MKIYAAKNTRVKYYHVDDMIQELGLTGFFYRFSRDTGLIIDEQQYMIVNGISHHEFSNNEAVFDNGDLFSVEDKDPNKAALLKHAHERPWGSVDL